MSITRCLKQNHSGISSKREVEVPMYSDSKIIFTWRLQQVLQLSFNICKDEARTCLFCCVNCIACLVLWTPTFPAYVNIWIVRKNSIALFAVMYFWCKVCIKKSPKVFHNLSFLKTCTPGKPFALYKEHPLKKKQRNYFLKNMTINTFQHSVSPYCWADHGPLRC